MSIFSNFTKRNNLIKTLQFKLTPMYSTAEQMEKLGVLDKDRERSECWSTVLGVLRRVDAAFIAQALTNAVKLDWAPLATALAANERANILRQQAEMRKAVAKLLTKHSDYKSLVNPTKAIKMAAAAAQDAAEAQAVGRFARFTTVLVDYFNLKKAFFTADERRTTIAYRIVHGNFPLYLENMSLLKQYAEAGLDFQDKFSFPILEINSYNKVLVQGQIEAYNRAVGQVNMELQRLYAQHKLPQTLKKTSLKLKMLQRQVMGGADAKALPFATYAEMQAAVNNLRDILPQVLSYLDTALAENLEQELYAAYEEKRTSITTSVQGLLFKENDDRSIVSIKSLLVAALALRRFVKRILKQSQQEQQELQLACSNAWELLRDVPTLYKNVRGFLTRKPYKTDKIRCYFDCAAFGRGWDVNKEAAYLLTMFRRKDQYYLGIRRRGAVMDFAAMATITDSDCYEKMYYKAFDFIKGMPSVLFSKLVLQKFAEGAKKVIFNNEQFSQPMELTREDFAQKYYVVEGEAREREDDEIKYLKGYLLKTGDEAGYREAVRQRIELAKRFIASYKAFEFFDMTELKPTVEYESWTEFINHVNEFTYGLRWQSIPTSKIEQLVEEGDLFFFRLDKLDFALGNAAQRQEDEQTLLLRELFSELNSEQHVLKLLGDVEIYYRPASLPVKITHAKGSVLVNKKDCHNIPLDPEVHRNISNYLNDKGVELLPEAAELLSKGMIKWRRAEQDIIKDKRYTQEQISIHFPIAINYRCPSNDYSFNKDMRTLIKDNPSVNSLGVHLGGSSLAEVVIVNQSGKILFQKEYNEFNQYNYAAALRMREAERQQAQRNWLQMEKIKNLRLGFISALVNEISRLMLEYNAIIVLEDYSAHKRQRGGTRPVFHMQFALQLLHKLNYLVLKDKPYLEPGGLLNAYQLVPKVTSLAGFANQIGCVFFVLPAYTNDQDGAANHEAYQLALKGLLFLQRINSAVKLDRVDFIIRNNEWLAFMQEHGLSS